jgi:hypothetical protein
MGAEPLLQQDFRVIALEWKPHVDLRAKACSYRDAECRVRPIKRGDDQGDNGTKAIHYYR